MKNIIIMSDSVEGRRNRERGLGNQDVTDAYQDTEIVCASVNDGCSGCKYPRLAAEINAKVAGSTARMIRSSPVDETEFKRTIANEYRNEMSRCSVPSDELCSTTAFVAIDKASGSFIAFSCGDSSILSFDSKLRVNTFLEPKNGFRKTLTYFTNDPYAVQYVSKLRCGKLGNDIAGFILYTDGAEQIADDLSRNDSYANRLLLALYSNKYAAEKDRLFAELAAHTSDDISIVVIAPEEDPRRAVPIV